MPFINRICDKIYVINLENKTDRLETFDKQMKKNKIVYERFNAIVGEKVIRDERLTDYCNTFCTDGMKGCALSHRTLWETVVKNGYRNVMICEDDAMIPDDFDSKFQMIYYQIPKDYDMLYLGCLFGGKDDSSLNKLITKINGYEPEDINTDVYKVKGTIGTHCYIISLEGAQKFVDKPISFHIDTQIMYWIKTYNYKSYAVNPLLVDSSQNNSSLSETYPVLLNSLFKGIPINNLENPSTLDWFLNESFLKLGPFNINYLILILMLIVYFIPIRLQGFIYLWLLTEFIHSQDFKNTFRYIVLLSIPVLIRRYK
jgi:GR25 family glycosyltransferase involved in LPS biosynthesis